MNAVMRDKCAARRIARAGCVDALGIVRARHMDTTLPKTNAERVSAWRARSHKPGFGGTYVRPWQAKKRDWNVTVPKSRPPIVDCPQGEVPYKPIQYIKQETAK